VGNRLNVVLTGISGSRFPDRSASISERGFINTLHSSSQALRGLTTYQRAARGGDQVVLR
jgi:hypothetical protein